MDKELGVYEKFTVTCDVCKGNNIELEDSRGYSETSGGWGSLDIICVDCGNAEKIADA